MSFCSDNFDERTSSTSENIVVIESAKSGLKEKDASIDLNKKAFFGLKSILDDDREL
ncbi:hypothetical protein [Flagellimonas hymeniacidonis]|uniref:hypothetical protein n=1 Tax=Flagellimonas hymeniacidonis TaxID=2603628 RepID=UPI00164F6EAB|nr:hypothetical protein [Flagellimonas hymeniacidonis]